MKFLWLLPTPQETLEHVLISLLTQCADDCVCCSDFLKPISERPDVRRLLLDRDEDQEDPLTLQYHKRLQTVKPLPANVVCNPYIHLLMPGATCYLLPPSKQYTHPAVKVLSR